MVHEHDEMVPRPTTDAFISAFHADSFIAEGFSHSVRLGEVTQEQIDEYHARIAEWLRNSELQPK